MWKPILITTNTSLFSIQPQYSCSQEIIISLVCIFWDLTITLYPWLSTVHLQWYLFLLETPTLGWWGLSSSLLTCQHCHQWGVHIRRNQTCTSGGFQHSRGEMYIVITIIQDEKNVREEQMECCGIHGVIFTFDWPRADTQPISRKARFRLGGGKKQIYWQEKGREIPGVYKVIPFS